MLFPSLEYTTLSLAATLITVIVGSTITGFPTFDVTSPVSRFTVYVVVVVLLPVFPGTVIFSCPFSRLSSFTYFLNDEISVVSTLFFAPSFLKISLVTFSVTFPVSESFILIVVDLKISSPFLLYTIFSPTFFIDLIVEIFLS